MIHLLFLFIFKFDTIKGNESHVGNFKFLSFYINCLSIQNDTFWFKSHLNWTFGCRDMDNLLKFPNNVKNRNLSPFSVYNSKSIFPTYMFEKMLEYNSIANRSTFLLKILQFPFIKHIAHTSHSKLQFL